MNKSELVDATQKRLDGVTRRQVETILVSVIAVIVEQVSAGNPVRLVGFGTFERRSAKKRMGRNPRTGEAIEIPARQVPAFKAGSGFKNFVREKHG